jgi:hypothetical protein
MPKTLMQSIMSELQKERRRLNDEVHRVAGYPLTQCLVEQFSERTLYLNRSSIPSRP